MPWYCQYCRTRNDNPKKQRPNVLTTGACPGNNLPGPLKGFHLWTWSNIDLKKVIVASIAILGNIAVVPALAQNYGLPRCQYCNYREPPQGYYPDWDRGNEWRVRPNSTMPVPYQLPTTCRIWSDQAQRYVTVPCGR